MGSVDPSVAAEAVQIVGKDRNEAYGAPDTNIGRIAALWTAYLGVTVTAADVAAMMVLTKISRSRQRYSRDNAVDGIGYLLIHEAMARDTNG